MSLVRWGVDNSDVYVYQGEPGPWVCCACHLLDGSSFRGSADDMITHLEEHKRNGDIVPDYVFGRLRKDKEEQLWGYLTDQR